MSRKGVRASNLSSCTEFDSGNTAETLMDYTHYCAPPRDGRRGPVRYFILIHCDHHIPFFVSFVNISMRFHNLI